MMQVIEGSYMPLPEPVCDGPAAKLYSAHQMTAYARACHEKWTEFTANASADEPDAIEATFYTARNNTLAEFKKRILAFNVKDPVARASILEEAAQALEDAPRHYRTGDCAELVRSLYAEPAANAQAAPTTGSAPDACERYRVFYTLDHNDRPTIKAEPCETGAWSKEKALAFIAGKPVAPANPAASVLRTPVVPVAMIEIAKRHEVWPIMVSQQARLVAFAKDLLAASMGGDKS